MFDTIRGTSHLSLILRMDPVTIFGLVSSAVQLATLCGSAVKDLNALVSKYKNAKLAILSMVQALDTMQLA